MVLSALALALSCSPKTLPYAGGLMLSVQTDLAAPKDVAAVGLFITSDGRPIFSDTRDVSPNGEVKFPATIAILGDEARPRAQIKIRVAAFKADGDLRILRDILTTVPKGRTALLRAPLLWINEGSGKGSRNQIVSGLSTRDVNGIPDGFTRLTSTCPDGQTFLEGECADATVDADALPDYQEKDVFGGGDAAGAGGRCFDVLACFGQATPVVVDAATCSASLGGTSIDDPNLSFAVALPPSAATGECRSDRCLVPLDKGTGWKPGGAGVVFPRATCARIASGAATGILRSTSCPTKDLATPSCGPASNVTTSSAPPGVGGGQDGGTSSQRDFDAPFAFGGEPGISSLAIDQDSVYLARTLATPPPSGVVKLSRADIEARKTPPAISTLVGYPGPALSMLLVGPQPKATHVLVRSESGEVRVCTPSSNNDCPVFPLFGDPRLIALGQLEAYAVGDNAGIPTLVAYPLASPAAASRVAPTVPPTAMLHAGSSLYFGLLDGTIVQCTVPCSTAGSYAPVIGAPPTGGSVITALAQDDRIANKLFVMRIPNGPGASASAGVFAVTLPSGPQPPIVSGADVTPVGIPTIPPSALAVDSEYVYFGGSFTDPRDGVRKNGLLRKRLDAPAGDASEPFLEATQGTADVVASVAVDANAVYWAYTRGSDAVLVAKKKRPF